MGIFGQKKQIQRAKIIGVRTAEDTKTLVTVNYGVYCFLVEYTDGTCGVAESKPGENHWSELMQHVKFDD